MAARKKSTESTYHQRLVRRLRRRYTLVVKRGDSWACFLKIDHQGFCVAYDVEKDEAEWYSLQLATGLARAIVAARKWAE